MSSKVVQSKQVLVFVFLNWFVAEKNAGERRYVVHKKNSWKILEQIVTGFIFKLF